MYQSIAELILRDHRWQLREAQIALASARSGSDQAHIAACEEHVTRMLSLTWNAQRAVERKAVARSKRLWLTAAIHDTGGMDIVGVAVR